MLWSVVLPPTMSSTTSTRRPPLASSSVAVMSSARESTATSAPSSRASARFSSLLAVAMTRPAPHALASCTAIVPTPCGGRVHDDGLARLEVRVLAQQHPGGRALDQHGQRGQVVDAVGHRERGDLGRDGLFGVPATAVEQRDDALAVRRAPDDLATGHERQLRRGEVGVLGLVGVGVVDADALDVDQHLTGPGHRIGQVDGREHLGSTELGHLNCAHLRPSVVVETFWHMSHAVVAWRSSKRN